MPTSFLAVQLCTLYHHYLVFLYMWLSVGGSDSFLSRFLFNIGDPAERTVT